MDFLDFTRQKVLLVLDEIRRLEGSEFPHPDAKAALGLLKLVFDADLARIAKTVGATDPKFKESACAQASSHIARFLPILGFALRSTNVRNSFELFIPILQLSRRFLGNSTRLILSSEWDFSPFTYPLVFPELPNFVMIGLPASEAGNALVVPLAGHELGHSVWRAKQIVKKLGPKLQEHVIATLKSQWKTFEAHSQSSQDMNKIETDMFIRSIWLYALEVSKRQIEEAFCDLLGVRIFGESYFFAMEYLISPHFGNRRSVYYPDIKTRMEAMEKAAAKFEIPCPDNFSARFTEALANLDGTQRFLLGLSDEAAKLAIPDVLAEVDGIANDIQLPKPSTTKENQAIQCFKSGIPASAIENLADVINAGWKCYFDTKNWGAGEDSADRFFRLNELMLKTIEVMEFQIRMRAP